MELISYLTQILVCVAISILLYILGVHLKKIILTHSEKWFDAYEYFPHEEILSLKQVHYLILILFIYICIINFFYVRFFAISSDLALINSLIDIILSTYLVVEFYDNTTKGRILSIFILPLVSISSLVFGQSILVYWNFLRIPALLYFVVKLYHDFLTFTEKNNLEKLILILISIIFTCLVLTMFFEKQDPINSLSMVSNAITSNGYASLGDSLGGILTSTFLAWSGYVISGVGTATLVAGIIRRNSKSRFEELENKIDNLERIIVQYHEEEKEKDE